MRLAAARSLGRELAHSALRAEGQELAATVRPKAPPLLDCRELIDLAMALLAADRRVVHAANLSQNDGCVTASRSTRVRPSSKRPGSTVASWSSRPSIRR